MPMVMGCDATPQHAAEKKAECKTAAKPPKMQAGQRCEADQNQRELQAKADAGSGAPVAVANRVQIHPATGEPLRQPVALRHQPAQRAVVRDQSVSWHEVTVQEQREYRQEEQQHYRKARPARPRRCR